MKFAGNYEIIGEVLPSERVLKDRAGIHHLWGEVNEDTPALAERLEIDGKMYYRKRHAASGEIWFAKL